MFDDIINAKIPVHPEIEKGAIEWVEYELTRIYGKKIPIYVPSLVGEAERMLADRLGKRWRKDHGIEIKLEDSLNGGRNIKVKIFKR